MTPASIHRTGSCLTNIPTWQTNSSPCRPRRQTPLLPYPRQARQCQNKLPWRPPANLKTTQSTKTKVGKAAHKAKHSIKQTIDKGERLGINQHLRSLWFGLRVGIVVLVFLLFGFFNEMFVAPFIQPSRKMTDTLLSFPMSLQTVPHQLSSSPKSTSRYRSISPLRLPKKQLFRSL